VKYLSGNRVEIIEISWPSGGGSR